jgi:type IV secretory pathway VirB3-like protein
MLRAELITLGIVFHITQMPLAELIQNRIGFGSIHVCRNKSNAIELVITSWEGYKRVVHLVNGNFRTPKILALHHRTLFDAPTGGV